MRWFRRLIAAVTLSALAVAALTWAGWPRPRFVIPLPTMSQSAQLSHERDLFVDFPAGTTGRPVVTSRTPWLGFSICETDDWAARPRVTRKRYWFVNTADGRTAGPWNGDAVASHAWDHRGAAVVNGGVPPAFAGAGALGRFDPETGRYTLIADDRSPDFLVSDNGETLLTFPAPRGSDAGAAVDPSPDADFVCFDLTVDLPTRTRIDFTIPGGRPRTSTLLDDAAVRSGGVALSPDGQTLAVAELWNGPKRVSAPGVTLFNTRTGRAAGRLSEYGAPASLYHDPRDAGAFDLAFSPDSRLLRFYYFPRPAGFDPVHSPHTVQSFPRSGNHRFFDVRTGRLVPPPVPDPTDRRMSPRQWRVQTADASRRLEWDGNPTESDVEGPVRFRVVDAVGAPLCDWQTPSGEKPWRVLAVARGEFVPDTTGLTWVYTTPSLPDTWWRDALAKLNSRYPEAFTEVLWYDWATGELRVVRRFSNILPALASVAAYAQDGRIAVLHRRLDEGDGTVEIWDAPPPRQPWAWSVPTGVAFGVLLTAAGVRLRRPRGG